MTARSSASSVPRHSYDRLPDFLCIGAQRAGTTLFHQLLCGHPDIFLPPAKELHALDTMAGVEPERWKRFRGDYLAGARRRAWRAGPMAWRHLAWAKRFALADTIDMAWYASLFREACPGQRAGDITPSYALLPPDAVAAAVAAMPELRVFFIIRDPIDRALSGAIHACTLAIGETRRPAMSDLVAELRHPRCLARSRYRMTIDRWEAQLPPGRLHVLQFDELIADPGAVIARVHAVLGIRPWPLPRRRHDRVNANPFRIDWPADAVRELAAELVDETEWLAQRYGGAAIGWAERARTLAII